MPFTLSHAAAVLPGLRRSGRGRGLLVASGLVAGSFAPDLAFFAASAVPGAMAFGTFTHSVTGVLTVDVLLAGVLAGVWLLVREPVVALLPGRWRGRVYGVVRGEVWRGRRVLPLAGAFWVSAVAGAATHVVWDSFTHHDRWGTDAFPALARTGWGGQPWFAVLQYGSSVVGLVVLGWFVGRALREVEPVGVPGVALSGRGRMGVLCLLGGAVVVGAGQRLLLWLSYDPPVSTVLDMVPALCFGAGTGLLCGLLLYAAALRLRHP
ncbi:DUF4184 family protein [Streptomyces bambusae]|uniref:DUF4184 family protein n=1 Tax=Streptomyces bambusae TaxID=1550616 RepID=UPI001CFCDA24|nr:DUF4184 family protein [Streptomyces bambusae]MCB5166771.1 DUF4184 family protein [Streptomyces bambusae]